MDQLIRKCKYTFAHISKLFTFPSITFRVIFFSSHSTGASHSNGNINDRFSLVFTSIFNHNNCMYAAGRRIQTPQKSISISHANITPITISFICLLVCLFLFCCFCVLYCYACVNFMYCIISGVCVLRACLD